MKELRIRWSQQGGHIHCRVFTGVEGYTFAKCGDLVFDEKEWPQIRLKLSNIANLIED